MTPVPEGRKEISFCLCISCETAYMTPSYMTRREVQNTKWGLIHGGMVVREFLGTWVGPSFKKS